VKRVHPAIYSYDAPSKTPPASYTRTNSIASTFNKLCDATGQRPSNPQSRHQTCVLMYAPRRAAEQSCSSTRHPACHLHKPHLESLNKPQVCTLRFCYLCGSFFFIVYVRSSFVIPRQQYPLQISPKNFFKMVLRSQWHAEATALRRTTAPQHNAAGRTQPIVPTTCLDSYKKAAGRSMLSDAPQSPCILPNAAPPGARPGGATPPRLC
jgi:hypothetical protein